MQFKVPFYVSIIFFLLISLHLFGQTKRDTKMQPSPFLFKGKIVESNGNQPIEFATVALLDPKTNTPVVGTTALSNGTFELRHTSKDVFIKVSFIGFRPVVIKTFEAKKKTIDLGTIKLNADNKILDEVTVRAEKSHTEFRLDKRVFNVGKDLSSTGASALEVLNNVPSVNVDIEGTISLRGSSGVQILINGKPSVLASEDGGALGTITAEMIDKVEVITNPSAKYDAEGSSGIINIVLKKEERKGTNGSITLNTGWPHNHSLGLSLNRRSNKFNLFSQMGVGYRELPTNLSNINTDKTTGTRLESEGLNFRNEQFYNFILGTDYIINENNIITVSGNFAYEIEDQPSETDFELKNSDATTDAWNRTEATGATNPKYQYELNYKRDFEDHKAHDLIFSALGRFFGKDQSSNFQDNTSIGTRADSKQKTRTAFKEGEYTFKLDYTRPMKEKYTLETGGQYVIKDVSNDYEVQDFLAGNYITDPNFTNLFEYNQKVLGIYSTGAYEDEKWGLKLGLRVEHTNLKTLLTNTSQLNEQNFTNLFPTVHTSYKLNDTYAIQGGYSRRIFRPRLWDLNPFFNIRNNFSVRTGNPELLPEFTDSYEISTVMDFDKLSMSASIFYRLTKGSIERLTISEENVNTTKPFNVGTAEATGLEWNFKYNLSKKVSFNGDAFYNIFEKKGSFENQNFDFTGDQWSMKMRSKIKFPASIDFEITGHYRSRVLSIQGVRSATWFADMGIRKKIIGGRGVINFSVRNLFDTRFRESTAVQEDFENYSKFQRGRFIILGFSYGFGKGEAMEFSGRKRF